MKKRIDYRLLIAILVLSPLMAFFPNKPVLAQDKIKVAIIQLVSHPSLDEIVEGVKEGLEAAGYKEGRNLEIDHQNAEGDMNLLTSIADTVMNKEPDIIFAVTTPVAQAFAHSNTDIPIILTGITDPVGSGLVDSLEKPGANITGVTDAVSFEQQFELILSLQPKLKKIGMLYSTSEDAALAELEKAAEVAKSLGIETVIQGIDSTLDMQLVAENLASDVEAIFIGSDNTIASAIDTLLDITDQAGIPVFTTVDRFVSQGAVSAVAIQQKEIGLQSAQMAVDVLKGATPATTPVQSIENLRKVYNSKAAEKLNISISDDVKKSLEDLSEAQ